MTDIQNSPPMSKIKINISREEQTISDSLQTKIRHKMKRKSVFTDNPFRQKIFETQMREDGWIMCEERLSHSHINTVP